MCKKQKWIDLAEKCDIARNRYWAARDTGESEETCRKEYQLARKAETEAYFDHLAN